MDDSTQTCAAAFCAGVEILYWSTMYQLNVNGKTHTIDAENEMPLLWVIREEIGLTGTKFGCGIAQCGACTVYLEGQPVRSCSIPGSAVADKNITTIEGLSRDASHPIQKAWAALDVPQCGYCQSGQIMAAAALLKAKPKPTDQDIDAAMSNICRCGTYLRIRAAIHMAAGTRAASLTDRVALVDGAHTVAQA